MVKPTGIPRWQAASPRLRAMWGLPTPLLPTAMTFSRRSMMEEARSESRPFGAVIACDRWRFTAGAAYPAKYAKELRDAGVELLCVWNKPPRGAQVARDPVVRRRRAA